MKTSSLILACLLGGLPSLAQGTIYFCNYVIPTGINAPVLEPDGVTAPEAGSLYVQLQVGSSPTSLAPVGEAIPISPSGYFLGGVVAIPGVAPGTEVWAQVLVWDARASSYEAALQDQLPVALSNLVSVYIGQPDGGVATAGKLFLQPIVLQVPVPEPLSALLLVLGLGVLGAFYRRGPEQ